MLEFKSWTIHNLLRGRPQHDVKIPNQPLQPQLLEFSEKFSLVHFVGANFLLQIYVSQRCCCIIRINSYHLSGICFWVASNKRGRIAHKEL